MSDVSYYNRETKAEGMDSPSCQMHHSFFSKHIIAKTINTHDIKSKEIIKKKMCVHIANYNITRLCFFRSAAGVKNMWWPRIRADRSGDVFCLLFCRVVPESARVRRSVLSERERAFLLG